MTHTCVRSEHGPRERRARRRPKAILRLTDRQKPLPSGAGVEYFTRAGNAGSGRHGRGELEHAPGESQRTLPQVGGTGCRAAKDLQHVTRFERGPDAPPDGLLAVGYLHFQRRSDATAAPAGG